MTARLRVVVARYRLAAMLHVLIVVCGMLILAIVSGITTYWNDIILMPASAAAFLGALAGAGGGLLAIILGALFNAELNRHRDDRLRRKDTAALMKALASEMKAISITARAHAKFLGNLREGALVAAFRMLEPAKAPIFEANADKIGWIPDLPRDGILFAIISRETVSATIHTIASAPAENQISAEKCVIVAKHFEVLAKAADDAVEALKEAPAL